MYIYIYIHIHIFTLRIQVWDCLASRVRLAALNNDVPLMHELVVKGADVDAPQRELAKSVGDSAHTLGRYDKLAPRSLYFAASHGHLDACRMLLESGAQVDAVCRGEELETLGSFVAYTPLKVAAEHGFLDVVNLLLQHGADATFTDESRWSILHWAACNNHAHVVGALASAGADINALNMQGRSPLALALTAGALEGAQALQDLGAVASLRRVKKVHCKQKTPTEGSATGATRHTISIQDMG